MSATIEYSPEHGSYTVHSTPTSQFLDLDHMNRDELETVFVRGITPELGELAGWEFRGMNTPLWARAVGIKKFVKGFYRPIANQGEVYGYNCPVLQDGVRAPWLTQPSDDAPRRFGYYRVSHVDAAARDNAYLHAVLLDYSKGHNSRFDPTNGLRDYLVQVDADNPNLYLGKAFYAMGPARVPVSFFVLERFRPASSDPDF